MRNVNVPMAKKRIEKGNHVSRDQANANAVAIRRFWESGRESLGRLAARGSKHGKKLRAQEQEAKQLGMNIDQAAKARRIAGEYSEVEVKQLCELIRRHHSRFGPSHWLVVIRVPKGKSRDDLTKDAVERSWSFSELERRVQREARGRRPAVGRKPAVPEDESERLLALDALAAKWLRWCKAAEATLPKVVTRLVKRSYSNAEEIQRAIIEHLNKRKSSRR